MEKHLNHRDYVRFVSGELTEDEVNIFVEKLINISGERVLKALPSVIDFLVKQTSYIKELSTDFYAKNKDLVEHKDLVAHIIEQVESDNPGKKYEEILAKVAPEARKKLSHTYNVKNEDAFSLDKTNEDLGAL